MILIFFLYCVWTHGVVAAYEILVLVTRVRLSVGPLFKELKHKLMIEMGKIFILYIYKNIKVYYSSSNTFKFNNNFLI